MTEIEFGFDLSDIVKEIKAKIKKTPSRAEKMGDSVKFHFTKDLTDSEVESVKTAVMKFAPHLLCKKVATEVKPK